MRDSFIINPDKNNGYPTFSDTDDITDVDFLKNPSMMQLCGDYPVYRGKSYLKSNEIKNTDFCVLNNYPEMKSVKFSLISGAFANARNLKKIIVPSSVKFIGETAFRNTQIKNITINKNCTFSETSFPDDCAVVAPTKETKGGGIVKYKLEFLNNKKLSKTFEISYLRANTSGLAQKTIKAIIYWRQSD